MTADEVWAVKERCAATIQRFTRGWLARIRYIPFVLLCHDPEDCKQMVAQFNVVYHIFPQSC